MCTGNKRMERERGVALIFTLAMLGLLMMLLLAFVGSMSVKKTVSSNAANKRQLDLLVNSAVSRLRLHLEASEKAGKNLDETVSSTDDSDEGPSLGPDASSAKDSFTDDAGDIELDCPDDKEKLYSPTLVQNQAGGKEPEWIYLVDPVSGSYFGRVAYAVIPNAHPILDLKAMGSEMRVGDQYNELNMSDFSSGFKSTSTVTVDKSNILNRDAYAVFYKNFSGSNPSEYEKAREYMNFLNIFTTANGLNSEDTYLYRNPKTADGQYRDSVWRRFDLGNDVLVDHEGTAFYSDSIPSDSRVKTLLGLENAEMKMDEEQMRDQMRYFDNNDKINNPDDRNAYCLPFFRKFDNPTTDEVGSSEYKGTFESADQLRNQVAANLIDYILDEDQTVTSNVTPESEDIEDRIENAENGDRATNEEWRTNSGTIIIASLPSGGENSWEIFSDNNRPEYTGNKRTLYLNEAGVVVSLDFTNSSPTEIGYEVYIYPLVELIDIYGIGYTSDILIDNMLDDYWMGISGNVKFSINASNIVGNAVSIDKDFPEYYLKPAEYITPNDGMYFLPRWKKDGVNRLKLSYSGTITVADTSKTDISISNIDIHIDAAKLLKKVGEKSGFVPVDFANINKHITGSTIELGSLSGLNNANLYASAYTYDPRQNLNSGDWNTTLSVDYNELKFSGNNSCSDIDTFGGGDSTFGEVNPHGYAEVDDDKKDNEDKITSDSSREIAATFSATPDERPISTAFIREAPMRSLWELGFIHRGVKWQTLNLKTVQAEDSDADILEFDPAYEKGDAEILDMVCLNYKNSPKFDINAKAEDISENVIKIWKGLLAPEATGQTVNIGNPGGKTADDENKDVINNGTSFSLSGESSESVKDIFIQVPNDAGVSVDTEENYYFDSSRKTFLRRSAIAPALYNLVKDENSGAKQEALIGKVIGLTDAYIYPPEVRVIVVAELLSQQNTTTAIDSVRKLVIMKRTLDGRYILSEILPL